MVWGRRNSVGEEELWGRRAGRKAGRRDGVGEEGRHRGGGRGGQHLCWEPHPCVCPWLRVPPAVQTHLRTSE